MTLMKTRPNMLEVLADPFDRFVDRMLQREFTPEAPTTVGAWYPALDFSETDAEFVVKLDVPGVHKENLDVTLDNNILTVSGRREFTKEEKDGSSIWRERVEGRFMRTVRLPAPVEEGRITASVDNGILVIHLPKTEVSTKSRIVIK